MGRYILIEFKDPTLLSRPTQQRLNFQQRTQINYFILLQDLKSNLITLNPITKVHKVPDSNTTHPSNIINGSHLTGNVVNFAKKTEKKKPVANL